MRRLSALLIAIALTLPFKSLSAQEALVLSGGGSRGLAHAGVFLALQQYGYDPDMVVGTSMGAVVGALYAAGYEPDEIRTRLTAVHWSNLFTPTPTVIGAERAIRYPMLTMDLDLARFRVSRGLLGQWRINRALTHLLFDSNARSRGDFDRLARRYRAVAADLKTGETVVLAHGDLARAARASMAVPGFFAPVRWDERILVDGGIADNLPTSTARELGAVRIIAVDVSRPPEEIHSQAPFAVIGRAIDLMQENTQRDTIPADVLILPKLEPGFSGATFPDDPTSLIEIGLAAARTGLPRLPTTGRGARPLPQPPRAFSSLLIEAPDSALAQMTRRAFASLVRQSYSADAVAAAVDALYTTGLFEAVWPRVNEADALVIRVDGPPRLSVAAGAHFEADRGGRGWASLDRYVAFARRPAILSASGSLEGLSRSVAMSIRLHSLLLPGLAWSAGAHAQEHDVRDFTDDVVTTKEYLRRGGWMGIEFPHILRERSTILSIKAEWIDSELGESGFAAGPLIRWSAVDPNDRVAGLPLLIEAERRWGDFDYTRLAARGSYTFLVGRRGLQLAPLLQIRGVSEQAPLDVHPALGDDHLVPGLRWGEQRAPINAALGVDIAHPLLTGFVTLRTRAGSAVSQLQHATSSRWHTGIQAGMLWPSPIGNVEFGYGIATVGDGRFDLSVGRRF